jgi:DNA-directed RNA polymerase subunit H
MIIRKSPTAGKTVAYRYVVPLVPEHIILSKKEKIKLLKELNIKPHQLPWILVSDPVCKRIGAKPGDVIMIIRKSPTAGKTVAYRYVVPIKVREA